MSKVGKLSLLVLATLALGACSVHSGNDGDTGENMPVDLGEVDLSEE